MKITDHPVLLPKSMEICPMACYTVLNYPLEIHGVEAEMFYLDLARGKGVLKMSWSASIGAEEKAIPDEISPVRGIF